MRKNKEYDTQKLFIPVVQVGIGIFVIKNNMILLGKRKGAHGAGQWQLPGGKPNIGEKFTDTAKREVLEETSLIINNVEPVTFSDNYFPNDNLHFATLYYLTKSFTGEPKLMEPEKCDGWYWFSVDNLPSPLFIIDPLVPEITQKIKDLAL